MERKFNNDFERFLKENADQYRLYPSTKVWNGVHAALHTRRKWFGLGISLLLLTGTLITFLISNSSKPTVITANKSEIKTSPAVPPLHSAVTDKRTSSTKVKNNIPLISGAMNYSTSMGPNKQEESIYQWAAVDEKYRFSPTSSFDPTVVNITDELTDQDFFNKQTEKVYSYP